MLSIILRGGERSVDDGESYGTRGIATQAADKDKVQEHLNIGMYYELYCELNMPRNIPSNSYELVQIHMDSNFSLG